MFTSRDATPPYGVRTARTHLDAGFRFEQAGMTGRALDAYRAAFQDAAARGDAIDEAEARLRMARVYRSLAQWADALREAQAARELARGAGENDIAAEAMNVEVGVHQMRGDIDEADAIADEALRLSTSPRVRGITLQNRGTNAARRGNLADADRLFGESVDAFREAGYELGIAIALTNAAVSARDAGNVERALELGKEAIAACRQVNALDVLLTATQNQAHALLRLGRIDEAEGLLTEALGHFTSAKNVIRQAECLEVMGELNLVRDGGAQAARRCFEHALALAQSASERQLVDRIAGRLAALPD